MIEPNLDESPLQLSPEAQLWQQVLLRAIDDFFLRVPQHHQTSA
jgi:hypothetical protein